MYCWVSTLDGPEAVERARADGWEEVPNDRSRIRRPVRPEYATAGELVYFQNSQDAARFWDETPISTLHPAVAHETNPLPRTATAIALLEQQRHIYRWYGTDYIVSAEVMAEMRELTRRYSAIVAQMCANMFQRTEAMACQFYEDRPWLAFPRRSDVGRLCRRVSDNTWVCGISGCEQTFRNIDGNVRIECLCGAIWRRQ